MVCWPIHLPTFPGSNPACFKSVQSKQMQRCKDAGIAEWSSHSTFNTRDLFHKALWICKLQICSYGHILTINCKNSIIYGKMTVNYKGQLYKNHCRSQLLLMRCFIHLIFFQLRNGRSQNKPFRSRFAHRCKKLIRLQQNTTHKTHYNTGWKHLKQHLAKMCTFYVCIFCQ